MAKTTIPAGYFAAGSIATADLADDAITSAKIADNAITAAMIPNATALTLDGGLTVDNITINGTEIDLSSGDLTVDVAGNLILAPGTDEVRLVGGSNDTAFGKFYSSGGNFYINMPTQDKDIIFSGNDGGTTITAMTIDMSEGGRVGIGTASPSELLHLTASSGHARLRTDNGTVTTFSGADSANSMLIGTSTNHAVRFVTNDSEIARFDTSGNLGIGTTSPGHILHIQDTDPVVAITTDADGEAAELRLMEDAAGTQHGGFIRYEGNGDYVQIGHYNSGTEMMGWSMNDSGNVGIGTTNANTLLHLTKASENADVDFIKMQMSGWAGSSGQVKNIAWSDGTNVCAIGPEFTTNKVNMHFHSFYNGGYTTETTKLFTINGDGNIDAPNGDITADNIYSGASGLETQIVSFPNTTSYPNNSTYSFTLTAAQAPLGSRVIMGIWITSGNSGGDQYMYLTQGQGHGPRLLLHVDDWYYNDGAMSMYKIDNAADRDFNVTHGTIVATNSNDFRRVYYYGYIMDN